MSEHQCSGPGCHRLVRGSYCDTCQRWADERDKHLRQIRRMLERDGRLQTADKLPPQSRGPRLVVDAAHQSEELIPHTN